jgi:anti-sigma factor ChrR (cupin superfamily)
MSVADDLRAARALIDTPEKAEALGGVHGAFRATVDVYSDRYTAMQAALLRQMRPDQRVSQIPATHSEILAMFDRAISKAESQS